MSKEDSTRDHWTVMDCEVAATLTLAVLGTQGGVPIDHVIKTYGDVLQKIRQIDSVNPPISGKPHGRGG